MTRVGHALFHSRIPGCFKDFIFLQSRHTHAHTAPRVLHINSRDHGAGEAHVSTVCNAVDFTKPEVEV